MHHPSPPPPPLTKSPCALPTSSVQGGVNARMRTFTDSRRPVAICCVLCCAALLYSPLQRGRWLFFPPPRRVWCTQPLPTPAREMASRPKLTALPLIPLTSTRCELVCPSPDDITLR
eukprot:GGOE01029206.1.p3 GENE.GGOE01029206.1~~GGOE01029206.1.p3  ORF type:complete len:117 (+),score=7.18 GGOE01029206.1:425-775(+)